MADEQDTGQDRTEEPTDKRRKDFRDQGRVAVSREVGSVVVVAGVGALLYVAAPRGAGELAALGRELLGKALSYPEAWTVNPLVTMSLAAWTWARVSLPVALVAALVGGAAAVAQVGLHGSSEPLAPDLKRLDPLKGLKNKLFSATAVAEWIKSLVKVTVVGLITWFLIESKAMELRQVGFLTIAGGTSWLGSVLIRLLASVSLAMAVMAVGDLIFQRWNLSRKMKMTREELRRETKEQDGDPHLKAQLRRRMQEVSMNRLVQEVSGATVVVTNPTHFAVALRYELGQPGAPVVVARGAGHLARRIKDIARSQGIPRVENKPLARALYARTRRNQEIPEDLFEATAEVLAFVMRLRQRHSPGLRQASTA